jgi:Macrocin-O-methyltransferase (TylF)
MLINDGPNELFGVPQGYDSREEIDRRRDILDLFKESPIPGPELLSNLALFFNKTEMARLLYLHEIYRKITGVHGVIMEFGVRWGQNLALFEAFRGIHEPFNRNRKIIGFDTFQGFPAVSEKDAGAKPGGYSVTPNYEKYLEVLLAMREREGPLAHVKKFELVKGDASVTVKDYLERHPETTISLAYFDLDVYPSTKAVLEAIKPYLTRGSVIALDELGVEVFPGETVALREVFGLDNVRLVHTPYSSNRAYFIYE